MFISSSDVSGSTTDLNLKLCIVGWVGWCPSPSFQKSPAAFMDECGLLFPGDFITSVYIQQLVLALFGRWQHRSGWLLCCHAYIHQRMPRNSSLSSVVLRNLETTETLLVGWLGYYLAVLFSSSNFACRYSVVVGWCAATILYRIHVEIKTALDAGIACSWSCTENPGDEGTLLMITVCN